MVGNEDAKMNMGCFPESKGIMNDSTKTFLEAATQVQT